MHFVQTFKVFPEIFFDCKLICCLLVVLILECDLLASFVDLRSQISHFFAIRVG